MHILHISNTYILPTQIKIKNCVMQKYHYVYIRFMHRVFVQVSVSALHQQQAHRAVVSSAARRPQEQVFSASRTTQWAAVDSSPILQVSIIKDITHLHSWENSAPSLESSFTTSWMKLINLSYFELVYIFVIWLLILNLWFYYLTSIII